MMRDRAVGLLVFGDSKRLELLKDGDMLLFVQTLDCLQELAHNLFSTDIVITMTAEDRIKTPSLQP
jgi:hypothetical protein